MLVFLGILSSLFFTFLIGLCWPHKSDHAASDSLLGYFAKSLWISWLLVFISYFTPIGSHIDLLLCLCLVGTAAYWLIYGKNYIYISKRINYLALLGSVALIGIFLFALTGWSYNYQTIFTTWDSVVSWNRWAIELFHNIYNPTHGTYPILFPGIWSLIYETQGSSDIWIFAKLSMLALPAVTFIYVALKLLEGKLLTAISLTLTICFIIASNFTEAVSGYMDYPLLIMMLLSFAMLSQAITLYQTGHDQNSATELLTLACMLGGLSIVTKQGGVAVIAPILYVVVYAYFAYGVSLKKLLAGLLIAVVPFAVFLVIYFPEHVAIVGNKTLMKNLSIIHAVNENIYLNAVYKLKQIHAPSWLTIILLGFAFSTLFKLKRLSGQVGAICLILAVAGFVLYSNCCSYDSRTGAWIYSLVIAAAILSIADYEVKLFSKSVQLYRVSAKYIVVSIIVGALCISAFTQLVISDLNAENTQLYLQSNLEVQPILDLVNRNESRLGNEGYIISRRLLLGHHPKYIGRFARHWGLGTIRARGPMGYYNICKEKHNATEAHTSKSLYPDKTTFEDSFSCKPESLLLMHKSTAPKNMRTIDAIIAAGSINLRIIDKQDDWLLLALVR